MKVKIKVSGIIIFIVSIVLLVILINLIIPNKNFIIKNYEGKKLTELKEFTDKKDINLIVTYSYSKKYKKDIIISQDKKDKEVTKDTTIKIVVSKGIINDDMLRKNNVNELGKIPVMMYHGIEDIKSENTGFTGGNIDKEGYQRTAEAFRADLDMYYERGYRCIKLKDYVNGNIDLDFGKSPIVLTFDDGLVNAIKVTGEDENGIIIDPNSAVGIMEEFKEKHPDFNITATFFVNGSLFNQTAYNGKILKWLVSHGYDVGNHTYDHNNLGATTPEKTQEVIAKVYQKLDEIIPNKYVNIIALPFGKPDKTDHPNFQYILKGKYNEYEYETIATLRVGWEPEYSPYNTSFNKVYIKRVRAWDNNGENFDIKYTFEHLEQNRYISDGDKDMITYPSSLEKKMNKEIKDKTIYSYEVD
jgi:hypothetical protein